MASENLMKIHEFDPDFLEVNRTSYSPDGSWEIQLGTLMALGLEARLISTTNNIPISVAVKVDIIKRLSSMVADVRLYRIPVESLYDIVDADRMDVEVDCPSGLGATSYRNLQLQYIMGTEDGHYIKIGGLVVAPGGNDA